MRPSRVVAPLLLASLLASVDAPAQTSPAPPGTPPPDAAPPTFRPDPDASQAPPPAGQPAPSPYPPPPYSSPPPGYPYPPPGYPYPPPYGYPPPAYAEPVPPPPAREKKKESRTFVFGAGLLVLAGVHWIDKPASTSVSAGGVQGTEAAYPGFTGYDLGWGLMLDARFLEVIGVEVDVLHQNDHGSGTINVTAGGVPCVIINNGPKPSNGASASYDLTIGQTAWHVPLLAKVSIPTAHDVKEGEHVDREIVTGWTTLAIGPELVFPGTAELSVDPAGLAYPQGARVSTYVMYTAVLGFEKRLTTAFDLRLTGSFRGSYDPSVGSTAEKRADYALASCGVVSTTYVSEWRYQLAATLGLGVFF